MTKNNNIKYAILLLILADKWGNYSNIYNSKFVNMYPNYNDREKDEKDIKISIMEMTSYMYFEFLNMGGMYYIFDFIDKNNYNVSDDFKSMLLTLKYIKLTNNNKYKKFILKIMDLKDYNDNDNVKKLSNKLEWKKIPYHDSPEHSNVIMRSLGIGLFLYGKNNRSNAIKLAIALSRITDNSAISILGNICKEHFW